MYKSLVESILTFNIVVWYGNLGAKRKAKLARVVGMAGRTMRLKPSLPHGSPTEDTRDLKRHKANPLFC